MRACACACPTAAYALHLPDCLSGCLPCLPPAHRLQGIGCLCFAQFFRRQLDGFRSKGIAPFLIDESHGDHAGEGLAALF